MEGRTLKKYLRDFSQPIGLTIYYDGECSVCSARIADYRRRADHGATDLHWHDVTQSLGPLAGYGVGLAAARRRLHVVDRDGSLHVGTDAFAVLWREVPGYRGRA